MSADPLMSLESRAKEVNCLVLRQSSPATRYAAILDALKWAYNEGHDSGYEAGREVYK